jgi:hypothetical protein
MTHFLKKKQAKALVFSLSRLDSRIGGCRHAIAALGRFDSEVPTGQNRLQGAVIAVSTGYDAAE